MNPEEVRDMVRGFQKSRILLSAFELDIFSFIGKDSFQAENIAEQLNLNKKATERLLNALVSLDILQKSNGKYSNTEGSFKYLSKDSPDYMAGLMHTSHLWDTWSHLTEVVKTGDVAHPEEINERGEEWLEAFIRAMHDRGIKQASSQISDIDLENVDSVLDIGGGSGCFSMAFLNRKPGLKTTIFDLPNVVPISKQIVEEEGYTGRIGHHTGDYMADELPKGYDLVFLSAIIHSNSFETNEELVQKCYHSLNPGGKIVIHDWIMNDDKTEPLQGALFSINMLVGVEGGDCYSEDEVSTWMKKAGFTDISRVTLDSGLGRMTGIKKA